MTSKPQSATVVDLQQAREEHLQMEWEKGLKQPDGTRLSPYRTYTPMAPYIVHPCQVIALPVNTTVEPDNPGPDTQPSLF